MQASQEFAGHAVQPVAPARVRAMPARSNSCLGRGCRPLRRIRPAHSPSQTSQCPRSSNHRQSIRGPPAGDPGPREDAWIHQQSAAEVACPHSPCRQIAGKA